MLAAQMEPKPTPKLSLAGAGSVLIGSTAAVIVVGILIGWLAGSTAWGFLLGAILGIPIGVFMTYTRYKGCTLMAGVFATPRPMPDQRLPFIAGAAVIVLALPIFLAAGWDLRGWVIGATLWAASRALAALLTHLRSGMGNLAGSGVVGFGMTFRALAVMVVVVVLAATDARLALAVVLLYGLAYTLELAVSLALYFSGETRETA